MYPLLRRFVVLETRECVRYLKQQRTFYEYPNIKFPPFSEPVKIILRKMVGAVGFELTTLCTQSRCATRLRYTPTAFHITRPAHYYNYEKD